MTIDKKVSNKAILVTGGAGYIGSHVVRQLGEAGETVIVLDNLCTGFTQAVLFGELIVGDILDVKLLNDLFSQHEIDTVMHFAAHTVVPESVADPLKYYGNNTSGSRNLLAAAAEAGVRHIVFSSTAAVYGNPPDGRAREDTPTQPINPYGSSKLMTEWMLRDLSRASALRYVALRYFNVAGCDPDGRIGQATPKASLLTKVACEAAVGKRDFVSIFGTDYATEDGTGVRDYIHVEDLARAHLDALEYLRDGGACEVLNCGYGRGYSVRELLSAVERANAAPLTIREEARRTGDPPMLVAEAERIRKVLGWEPQLDNIDAIVTSALAWERRLIQHPWSRD
ncbi:MAG: UDP-glucose 4-epimerase GalE [Gammaproteobacteria bacterium]